jgi:hypothetical protein
MIEDEPVVRHPAKRAMPAAGSPASMDKPGLFLYYAVY